MLETDAYKDSFISAAFNGNKREVTKLYPFCQNGSCVPPPPPPLPLTSKLCVKVWRTGYEFSLNPGSENWKLEMETPTFPAKIDFNFHWKVQAFKLKLQNSDRIFSFVSEWRTTSWVDYLNLEGLCYQRYERE